MSEIIGYNVYRLPDGCTEEFAGFVETQEQAEQLAKRGKTLPQSLYGTARAAGHCAGLYAPDKSGEDTEPTEWWGDFCAVAVFA